MDCGRQPKRVLTVARREQNRAAQRLYRLRRKQNTQTQPTCVVLSQRLRPLKPRDVEASTTRPARLLPLAAESNGARYITNSRDFGISLEQPPIDSDHQHQLGFIQLEEIDLTEGQHLDLQPAHSWDMTTDDFNETIPSMIQVLSQSDVEPQINRESLDEQISSPNVIPLKSGSTSFIPVNNSRPDTHDFLKDLSAPFRGPLHRIPALGIATPPPLPSLYETTLKLYQTSIFTAGLQNAVYLNIKLQSLMTTSYRSPFYTACPPSSSPDSLIATASSSSFPAPLQPTLPQIMFPHHAYLDLLPFPQIRARAIMLMAANPPLVDPKEFKEDIMREGLRFLGGRTWDSECWRVERWFRAKWRLVIEGESWI